MMSSGGRRVPCLTRCSFQVPVSANLVVDGVQEREGRIDGLQMLTGQGSFIPQIFVIFAAIALDSGGSLLHRSVKSLQSGLVGERGLVN